MPELRYGICLPAAGPAGDPRTLARAAHRAEAAGWDGVFLEDYLVHHTGPDVATYGPWIYLAGMAVATERVRLGTCVTPLPPAAGPGSWPGRP